MEVAHNLSGFVAQGLSGSGGGEGELLMDRTTVLQEIRKMRFEETWEEWKKGRLDRKKGTDSGEERTDISPICPSGGRAGRRRASGQTDEAGPGSTGSLGGESQHFLGWEHPLSTRTCPRSGSVRQFFQSCVFTPPSIRRTKDVFANLYDVRTIGSQGQPAHLGNHDLRDGVEHRRGQVYIESFV